MPIYLDLLCPLLFFSANGGRAHPGQNPVEDSKICHLGKDYNMTVAEHNSTLYHTTLTVNNPKKRTISPFSKVFSDTFFLGVVKTRNYVINPLLDNKF